MAYEIWPLAGIVILVAATTRAESQPAQITILCNAFGKTFSTQKDWGFSACIEYGGMRILFDTGNNAGISAHTVKAGDMDLTKLDFECRCAALAARGDELRYHCLLIRS